MKTKQNYSVEFRTEAVKLVLEQELSQGEAASRLGIPKGTLANWVVATTGRGARSRPLERAPWPSWRRRMLACARSSPMPAWSGIS